MPGVLNGGDAMLLPYLIFGSLLAAAPVLRIINLCYVERVLDTRLGIAAICAHFSIILVLWSRHLYDWLMYYLLALLIFALISPVLNYLSERFAVREISDEDIHRFRRRVEYDPHDAAAHMALANACAERGRARDAIRAYDRSVTLDAHYAGHASARLRRLVESRTQKSRGRRGASTETKLTVPDGDASGLEMVKDDMHIPID